MPEISITTTQNVNINFNVANLGVRILANIVDGGIKLAYIIFMQNTIIDALGLNAGVFDNWSVTAIYIVFMSPVIFYSLAFETFMEGQSPGKKLLKIKVAKIDGYQASFMDYLTRWVLRIVDGSATMYLAGLISMSVSKFHQRLGDMAAGTAVISLKNDINIGHTILTELAGDYQPVYPQVVKFSDNDMRIIKETYISARDSADSAVMAKLVRKIEEVGGIKCQTSPSQFVGTIIRDYNYYTGQ